MDHTDATPTAQRVRDLKVECENLRTQMDLSEDIYLLACALCFVVGLVAGIWL